MERLAQILICDDDPSFHLAIKYALKRHYECRSAYHSEEAATLLRKHSIDLLLLDVQMRTPEEGIQAIPIFKEIDPDLSIIMSTASSDLHIVKEAMKQGAADYILKDTTGVDLVHAINRTLEKRRLIRRRDQQNYEALTHQNQHLLIGNTDSIVSLRKTIEKLRNSSANVVIHGETGTGKEVVARQLRKTLPDGSLAPFVAVDSATIQSTTAESLLFGHERGAFTGAEKMTKGIFEEANGGTVYFDEIANMPLDIQAKLLRVLQEREISRLGSSRVIQLDFRVICATNQDLEELVKQGRFKDDLFQRLHVLPVYVPPLRDRKEDIPSLVEHFAKRQRPDAALRFTPDALETLKNHSWPGNVRELANLVSYVITMTEGDEVDVSDLPPKLRDSVAKKRNSVSIGSETSLETTSDFYQQVGRFESELLKKCFHQTAGNISKLALQLGMDRSHLYTKLREYGIHPRRSTDMNAP